MTRIIIESDNKKDLSLIKELVKRLKLKYEVQDLPGIDDQVKDKSKVMKVINKGIDVSNYGDPSLWQKEVPKTRDLEFPK